MRGISPYLIFIVIHGLLSPVCAVGALLLFLILSLLWEREGSYISDDISIYYHRQSRAEEETLPPPFPPLYMMHIKSGWMMASGEGGEDQSWKKKTRFSCLSLPHKRFPTQRRTEKKRGETNISFVFFSLHIFGNSAPGLGRKSIKNEMRTCLVFSFLFFVLPLSSLGKILLLLQSSTSISLNGYEERRGEGRLTLAPFSPSPSPPPPHLPKHI